MATVSATENPMAEAGSVAATESTRARSSVADVDVGEDTGVTADTEDPARHAPSLAQGGILARDPVPVKPAGVGWRRSYRL